MNWTQLIQDQHQRYHPHGHTKLILQDGATDDEIDALSVKMGFKLPDEFRDLYRTHNGFGTPSSDGPNAVRWSFLPLSLIEEKTKAATGWMQETHPDIARGFFVFMDYLCGDYSGYFFDNPHQSPPDICTFEHELYEFDASQPAEEFFSSQWASLREILET